MIVMPRPAEPVTTDEALHQLEKSAENLMVEARRLMSLTAGLRTSLEQEEQEQD